MKRILTILMALMLVTAAFGVLAEPAEQPLVFAGKVQEIEKYGHALLDITIEEFTEAGFELGDIVTVTAGSYTGDMPYLNGYYVENGEYMLRAYPGHEYIAVCINYGKFNEAAGVDVGDEVTIALKEKAGALTLQEVSNLVYTNDRADYASDEVFANFRMMTAGEIGEGKLYRSASPVDSKYGRGVYAIQLAQAAGITAIMNLTDSEEYLAEQLAQEDYDRSWYADLYAAGNVIPLGMPVNYASDEFADGIVRGLVFLSEHETPFLIHCTEGKDRAGYTAMLLEALMGATEEEIVADYMTSFANYYGIEPGTDKYDTIVARNIHEMMCTMAGLDRHASLEGVDLQAATVAYLEAHGMAKEAITALQEKLR